MDVDSDDQVAYYDSGAGTNYLKITGRAFGLGLSKNIMECYAHGARMSAGEHAHTLPRQDPDVPSPNGLRSSTTHAEVAPL